MKAPPFPLYCAARLGRPNCPAAAHAARLERRRWSKEYRAGAIRRERLRRLEARTWGACAHCGRDTKHGPALEHRTFEDCARRYPALVTCLAWILVGSESEAACCIRDARDRLRYGAEVVSHSGLSPADRLEHARRAWHDPATRRHLGIYYRGRRAARAALLLEVSR